MSNVVERSTRSILVGNLPSDINEEILRDVFAKFGSVVTLKCFKDGACGYAFCEFDEEEMAHRAIHGLSNFEYQGKILKVDIASSERSKEELESLYASIIASPFEASDGTEKAPEELSKAVASLPAEQMFELMKQMKMCIENNPQEARSLLLQNPQLAFALLQAQVIMRIVDPAVALKIFNRPEIEIENPEVEVKSTVEPVSMAAADTVMDTSPSLDQDMRQVTPMEGVLHSGDTDMRLPAGDSDMRNLMTSGIMDKQPFDPRFRGNDPRIAVDPRSARQMQDPRNPSSINPRIMPGSDPRIMPGSDPRAMPGSDPRVMPGSDPRVMPGSDPRVMPGSDPRVMPGSDPRIMPGSDPRIMTGSDPRIMPGSDPRLLPGSDPRILPGSDPRILLGSDPRILPGSDPRILPGSDPRILPGSDPRILPGSDPRILPGSDSRIMPVSDPRGMAADPRMTSTVDPRIMPSGDPRVMAGNDPRALARADPRIMPGSMDPRMIQGSDPRIQPSDPRSVPTTDPRMGPNFPSGDPRVTPRVEDPRTARASGTARAPPAAPSGPRQPPPAATPSSNTEDEEKAALIMQVLQLSDEQIALLPPDQRQSIIVLKEQIARSHLHL